MDQVNRVDNKIVITLALTVVFAVLAVACGTDAGSGGAVPRVVASDRVYTIDDLTGAGAKTVKEYDVEDLPGATAVWKSVFNKLDYEARFYPTHDDAVAQGTSYADSVTGDDAVVTGDDILWDEGKRDRRKCSRAAETPHSSCTYSARYLEYVIRGNMILFCEGNESSDAFANCGNLLALIDPA